MYPQVPDPRVLTARSFALRAATLGLIEAGRAHVAASRLLLERVRALDGRVDVLASTIPSTGAATPSVRDWLRRKLGAIGARERETVRVLFDVAS